MSEMMARTPRRDPPEYRLTAWSTQPHLSQVYTGLAMLHQRGLIRLHQQIVPPPARDEQAPHHLRAARLWHAQFDTQGRRFYVDVHDSHEIADVSCDVYLKRSYLAAAIPQHMTHKVRPLGLNYEVHQDGFDPFELRRRWALNGARSAARYVGGKVIRPGRLTVSELQARSSQRSEPHILFMCRAWDPDELGRSVEKNAERRTINQVRAECVLALRKEFGSRFTGGFAHTPYAVKNFPHVLLPHARMADRGNYLRILREHQIGIASMGLHGSNGWKLAEYVARGMAIVCEPLVHEVPDFHAETHYLAFRSALECVAAAGRILDSPKLRASIRQANETFYQERLRPDRLVQSAVARASSEDRDTDAAHVAPRKTLSR
jgi:hypothetical protein